MTVAVYFKRYWEILDFKNYLIFYEYANNLIVNLFYLVYILYIIILKTIIIIQL